MKQNQYDQIIEEIKSKNLKKISFSGTHGTGKTTSCYELASLVKKEFGNKKLDVLSEVTYNSPFKINQETTTESQLWICVNQIQQELNRKQKYDLIICDRTIIDCAAYTFRQMTIIKNNPPKSKIWFDLYNQILEIYKTYDNIFPHDLIIFKQIETNDYNKEDGKRDTNNDFRTEVESIMKHAYTLFKDPNIMYV